MRILLVSQEYPPETGWGGIGTYLGIIAPALARTGAEVHVLSVVPGQDRSDRVVDGVHVHRAPLARPRGLGRLTRLPDTWNRLSLAVGVARERRRLGQPFDVVEYPEWNAEGLVDLRRGTRPVVVRLHSSAHQVYHHSDRHELDARWSIRLEEAAIRRATLVTGTAAQIAEAQERFGLPPARSRAITYPVQPAVGPPLVTVPPCIVFAGRFERRKGPETLVRALPGVVEKVSTARLVLVGRDTSEPGVPSVAASLRATAETLGVSPALEIVERWGHTAVAEWLGRATVCAVPSRWESFGYVAAEAAALGRPVVASRIPALTDPVEHGVTGLLVDPDDIGGWADALAHILSSPAVAREMGAAGAARMAEQCHPDLVAAQTLSAYRDAMDLAGPGAARSAAPHSSGERSS